MSGCSKFLWCLLGIVLGFILTLGAIAGAGYYIYSNVSLNTIEKTFKINLDDIPSDIKNKTIKTMIPMISEASNMTVQNFCTKYEITFPTKFKVGEDEHGQPLEIDLTEAFSPVLNSKVLDAFGKLDEVADYFTIKNTFGLLGQVNELPDFRFVNDAQYKDKPITNLLSMIDELTVADILPTGTDLSSGILSQIKDTPIMQLAEEDTLQGVIDDVVIKDVIDIDEGATGLWGAIKDCKISELQATINTLTMQQILNISSTATGVLGAIKDLTIDDLSNETTLKNAISDIEIQDVITIDESSTAILKTIRDCKIGELQSTIDNITMKDIITINASSNKILISLQDCKISEIESTLNTMTLSTIIEFNYDSNSDGTNDSYSGFLSYLEPETTLITAVSTKIDEAIQNYVENTTIDQLRQDGFITVADTTTPAYQTVKDKTIKEVLESVVNA